MKVNLTDLDLLTLVRLLLPYNWQRECEIIPNYKAKPGDKPQVVVRWKESFLRYSGGPAACYFWDFYGDDFRNVHVALLALNEACPPCHWKDRIFPLFD
jgi:hypothetical protein